MPAMTKEERREKMPECTRFIEWIREQFTLEDGLDPIVGIRASENGETVEWRKG